MDTNTPATAQIINSLFRQAKQLHTIATSIFVESQKQRPSKKDLAKYSYNALMISNALADIAEMVAGLDTQQATQDTGHRAMNQHKDTTPKLTTPQGANKPPIKRVIHGLLDCLLIAGMILFVLILATYCQPAHALPIGVTSYV